MRLLTFAAILPFTLGAPIVPGSARQTSLDNMELKTMVTEANVEFNNGRYVLFAANRDNLTDSQNNAMKGSNRLEFSASDGKLTVLTVSGRLVGNVLPSSAGYTLSFNTDWLNSPEEALPDVRGNPTNDIQKRGAGLASVLARARPNIGFWVTFSKTLAKFLNLSKTKHRSRREDPADSEFLEPVFVTGPGVNFASVLELENMSFQGDSIQLVGKGALFLDVDNVIDYQNCALCNLPTSS